MRAGRKGSAFCVLAALAALTLLPGCVIPGASFGTEPLQLRFADATRTSLHADHQAPAAIPAEQPIRSSESGPVVILAGREVAL